MFQSFRFIFLFFVPTLYNAWRVWWNLLLKYFMTFISPWNCDSWCFYRNQNHSLLSHPVALWPENAEIQLINFTRGICNDKRCQTRFLKYHLNWTWRSWGRDVARCPGGKCHSADFTEKRQRQQDLCRSIVHQTLDTVDMNPWCNVA